MYVSVLSHVLLRSTQQSSEPVPKRRAVSQGPFAILFGDSFAIMNTIGLVAFALVGSSKAIREEFDLLSIPIVGLAMAFARGMTRDPPVTRVPLALQSPIESGLGLLDVGLAIALRILLVSPDTHPITLVTDMIGLATFATTGTIVVSEAGVSAFGVVAIATVNDVGGAVADILLDRTPFILFEDLYATCTVLGGIADLIAGVLGASGSTAAGLCAVITVATR